MASSRPSPLWGAEAPPPPPPPPPAAPAAAGGGTEAATRGKGHSAPIAVATPPRLVFLIGRGHQDRSLPRPATPPRQHHHPRQCASRGGALRPRRAAACAAAGLPGKPPRGYEPLDIGGTWPKRPRAAGSARHVHECRAARGNAAQGGGSGVGGDGAPVGRCRGRRLGGAVRFRAERPMSGGGGGRVRFPRPPRRCVGVVVGERSPPVCYCHPPRLLLPSGLGPRGHQRLPEHPTPPCRDHRRPPALLRASAVLVDHEGRAHRSRREGCRGLRLAL
mmetsp:Transcript_67013/g.212098  ORF Transcript_67013/g.212098 Transcript_67013/m.212098 type:complete len:276 (+) Transcript_67013:470-1297(+)